VSRSRPFASQAQVALHGPEAIPDRADSHTSEPCPCRMKTNPKFTNLVLLQTAVLALSLTALDSIAQTNAVTYQGQLTAEGSPANGSYDLIFQLFDAPTGGNQVNGTITNANQALSNGLFTATLDFGSGAFPGSDRWLQIGVRTSSSAGAFVPLSPRQLLTPAPYALYANMAQTACSVSAADIVGHLTPGQLPVQVVTDGASGVSLSGTFTGNGAGLTGIKATNVSSIDPATTILLSLGDSKGYNLFAEMQSDPRFSGFALITNCAVAGSFVLDSSNMWATNAYQVSKMLQGGTQGVLVYFGCHNNQDNGYSPLTDINTISNVFLQAISNNWLIMPITTQARVPGDKPSGWQYIAMMDNWMMQTPLAWRAIDAYSIAPNCYDTSIYNDGTHWLGSAISNLLAPELLRQFASPRKIVPPQWWTFTYGTNTISAVPGASNAVPQVVGTCTAGGVNWTLSDGSSLSFGLGGMLSIYGPGTLWNQFIGNASGNAAATGYWNVGLGQNTLTGIASGVGNTALGYYSMAANTTGTENTSEGGFALWSNTDGNYNLANGYASLFNNVSGNDNVAVGYYSMYYNTRGVNNVAVGTSALEYNTSGSANTAVGTSALYGTTSGGANVGIGEYALAANTSGNNSTAVGAGALDAATTGNHNVGLGYDAGANVTGGSSGNTFVGSESAYNVSSGNANICIGAFVDLPLSTGSGQLNIGNLIQGTGAYNSQNTSSSNIVTGGVVTIGGGLRYPQQHAAPTAASIGGTVGSVTNHLMMNVNGLLMDYWSDGKTLYSKRLAP